MEHPIREILEFVSCIKLVPWPMFIIGTNGTSKMATTKKFKMYLPKQDALQIISEDDYNMLLDLSNN